MESSARLVSIESLIPEALRPAVKAGPIDGETWCLLVHGNAAAAKVRQLIPRIQSRLGQEGWKVTSIRLKILIANNSQKVVLDGFSQVRAGKVAARVKERG